MNYTPTQHLDRFKLMGYAFFAMALLFTGGAYLFPVDAPENFYDWFYLTEEEKESFYMISIIFIVAGIYCIRKNR